MRRLRPNRAAATYPVTVAGALFGLGRHASYTAARSGAFPTIKINGCLVAVAEPINQRLTMTGGIDNPKVRAAFELCGFEPPPLTAGDPAAEASANSDAEKPRAKLKPGTPSKSARGRSKPKAKLKMKSKAKPGSKATRGDASRPAAAP